MSRMYCLVPLMLTALALPACRTEPAETGRATVAASSQEAVDATQTPESDLTLEPEAAAPGTEVASGMAPEPEVTAGDPASEPESTPSSEQSTSSEEETPSVDGSAESEAEPDPEEQILEQVEESYDGIRSMQADFVQRLTVPLLGSSQTSRGKIYQRRPDRFLMQFTDPAGDVLVADGEYFWMYYPSTDSTQVIRTRITEGSGQADLQQEFLRDASERYVATLIGEEQVDGRPAHVLTLVPKGQSPYKVIKVWVDKEDYLVRRFEMTEENDSVRRIDLNNLRLNVELPDSLFEFTPPPGTQVFEQ